jgi:hypothetical protein
LIDKQFIKQATFINERAMKPRDVKQWRVQRIAELKEELRKLTTEQEYEKQQLSYEPNNNEQTTEKANEIIRQHQQYQ